MMRSANAICIVAFIVVVVAAAAAFTTTTEAAAAAAAPGSGQQQRQVLSPPASPAALEFLKGRFSPGVMPEVTPSSRRPAGTFNGSSIRVIGAVTELMLANFRSLLAEVKKLDGAKYKLGKCADQAAEFEPGKKEPEKLAKIRALAAMGDDNKVEAVYDLSSWMDDVNMSFEKGCQAEMKAVPDADKLLAAQQGSHVLLHISAYTPPRSEMTYP